MRWHSIIEENIKQDALSNGIPVNVAEEAEKMYNDVIGNPMRIGNSKVVDGYWIESHTYGCRNAADDSSDTWMDQHWNIYDEYKNDGVSTVLGDPIDGVFITITPQSVNS